MVEIRILKKTSNANPGDIGQMSKKGAAYYVENGIAEYTNPKETKNKKVKIKESKNLKHQDATDSSIHSREPQNTRIEKQPEIAWLTKLFYEIGYQNTDFRVTRTFKTKEGNIQFTKWIPYLDAQETPHLLQQANQREQLKNEIILDFDTGNHQQYLDLIERIKQDKLKFYAYSTNKHRANHIHTYWNNLAGLTKRDREAIRKIVIEKYGCDLNLISDLHVIPIENVKHWKTGETKKLIDEDPGINDSTYLIDILKEKQLKKKEEKVSLSGLSVDNFLENIKHFHSLQPFFYDKNNIFWFWNHEETKWEIVDETDIMNSLEEHLKFNGQTINANIKNQYLEGFKRVGRHRIPKDAKNHWIQFRNKAFSLKSGNVYEVTPDYFFTNPIPWDMAETNETPIIDKLFEEWVGPKYKKTLYELVAYCCYTAYPISLIFGLVGSGRNGKSKFLALLTKFVGVENTCSTELDTLTSSRFESFKLYKKLVCAMGETNFGILNKTSILKKLSGEDAIGFEMKNKRPFDDINYAKIIISSNSLPSTEDQSEGYYRRWNIIDFPNEFPEGKDILQTIPEEEYSGLATKVTEILPGLLKKGTFTNQGTIAERRDRYVMSSNPLPLFLKDHCTRDPDLFVSYNELYNVYVRFLLKNKKRKVSRKEFKASLEDEGFYPEKTSKKSGFDEEGVPVYKILLWVEGLGLKDFADFAIIPKSSTSFPVYANKLEKWAQKAQKQNRVITKDDILQMLEEAYPEMKEIDDLVKKFGSEAEGFVRQLLSDGLILEARNGRVQFLK